MRFVENEHVVQPFLSVSRVPQTGMYVVSCGSKLNYSVPVSGVEYCDDRLSVCLSASISPETNVRSLPYFLCTLPMSVASSFSGGVAIRHVLPVYG